MSEQTDIAAKVAVLTTEHQSLRADHNAFLLEFRTFADDVRKSLAGAGKTNWQAVGVILAAIGGIAGIYIAPMQVRFDAQEKSADQEGKIQHLELELRCEEIESQFRGLDNTHNAQYTGQLRIIALLWKKAYGDDFPQFEYSPSISK